MSPGIRVRAQLRTRDVDLDLELPANQCTAILGANGAGKSTLVGLLSGALQPDDGGIVAVHGQRLAGGSQGFVPPHRRGIALLEQRPLLFPNMDVLANVAFGMRCRGTERKAAKARAEAQLAAVGCAKLAGRRSHQLSGGQAQRIALARALVITPEVLLLDEPLAALDVAAAPRMRRLLHDQLAGRTAVLVTHDLLDVLTLAQHVVVLEAGRVIESGPAARVLARPTSRFLADFTGVNLLTGEIVGDCLRLTGGPILHGLPEGDATAGTGWASVPANAVSLHLDEPHGSPRNNFRAEVRAVEPRGPVVRVLVDLAGQQLSADLTTSAVAELGLVSGTPVVAAIKATAVKLY